MLRVAQVIESVDLASGGTSTAFLNVLAALQTRPDLRPVAFTQPPSAGDPAWDFIRADQSAWRLTPGTGRGLGPGPLGSSAAADVRARRFDVVHLHGLWSPDLLAIAKAARAMDIPCFWEPHGMLVREAYAQKRVKKEVFMALGLRRALVRAAGLVFVTAEERDHSLIPAAIGPERRHVVPLPVREPALAAGPALRRQGRERFGLPADAPVVVFMGRLHPVKRVELALGALARTPGAHLLLAGGGDEAYTASLRALAAQLGIAGRVVFAGWVQGNEKWLALAAGDTLTLQSLHENFGFVAVEALCVGALPVLTRNLALAAELESAGVAIACDPTDQALAGAWSRAIDANRAGPVLDRGRDWVRQHLSTEAIGRRLEDLYRGAAA